MSWLGIVRLGLVQAALGAIVVLVTSTLNRVMVVELSLPAILPGILVALHYGVQVLRPRLGFGADIGGRCTPWIVGGMALLAAGGISAAAATALMATHRLAGIALALPAYLAVGIGVGAAGTSLLALMAKQVTPRRRAPAATILWMLMILGIAVSATVAGKLLEPFSIRRLIAVIAEIAGVACALAMTAVWNVERKEASKDFFFEKKKQKTFENWRPRQPGAEAQGSKVFWFFFSKKNMLPSSGFLTALREIWAETQARRFAIFVFVSMLAYSAQELILEPFAGAVFRMTPGQTAGLTGTQHGGVMAGMLLVAVGGSLAGEFRARAMRFWTVGGCIASALALTALGIGGLLAPAWPLRASVFILGAANGAFAVSAIGAMMGLASQGRGQREGVRMGLWGAAQAVAFGAGGLFGTSASDLFRSLTGTPALAYAAVFGLEAALFLFAARLAGAVFQINEATSRAGQSDAAPAPNQGVPA